MKVAEAEVNYKYRAEEEKQVKHHKVTDINDTRALESRKYQRLTTSEFKDSINRKVKRITIREL